jgi:SAM-dependent methyltransferase
VLDAAAGIGIEAAYLLNRNYFLVVNEIEPELRHAAHDYAREVDARIPEALFTRLDWMNLGDGLMRGSFQAVYVLGNSLCHLESLEQVDRALANFYEVLAPGGVLICDERNFQYILSNWSAIQADPWNAFRFNKRREPVMYHGRRVMGAPIEQRRDRIIFQYAEVRRDSRGRITQKQEVGELSMLAFPRGVLKERLARARFGAIEVYGDLTRDSHDELSDDADFFTYVAVKPALNVPKAEELVAAVA